MPKREAISVDTMLTIIDRLNSQWGKQADLAREYYLAKSTIVTFKKLSQPMGLCPHS
jgi:hypothetical protein